MDIMSLPLPPLSGLSRLQAFADQLEGHLGQILKVAQAAVDNEHPFKRPLFLPSFLTFVLNADTRSALVAWVIEEGVEMETRRTAAVNTHPYDVALEDPATQDALRWLQALREDRVFAALLSELAATTRPLSAVYDPLRWLLSLPPL